jgi:hypothetical protein
MEFNGKVEISLELYDELRKKEREYDLVVKEKELLKKECEEKIREAIGDICRFVLNAANHKTNQMASNVIHEIADKAGFRIVYETSFGQTSKIGEKGSRVYHLKD